MFGFKTKSQFELFLIILISIILVYLIIVYIYKPKNTNFVSKYKKHYSELPTDPVFMKHTLSDNAIRIQNILFSNIMSTIGKLTNNDIMNNAIPMDALNVITRKEITKETK